MPCWTQRRLHSIEGFYNEQYLLIIFEIIITLLINRLNKGTKLLAKFLCALSLCYFLSLSNALNTSTMHDGDSMSNFIAYRGFHQISSDKTKYHQTYLTSIMCNHSKSEVQQNFNADTDCAVCMEPLPVADAKKDRVIVRCTNGHTFCSDCIDTWAEENKGKRKCPMCRVAYIPMGTNLSAVQVQH